MNVSTILVSKEEAKAKLDEYKAVSKAQRREEDDRLIQLYKSVTAGARVLNLQSAFRETGLNEFGQPRLAIARADWKTVHCFSNPYVLGDSWGRSSGTAGFSEDERWETVKTRANILLPDGTLPDLVDPKWRQLRSPVPHIPPKLRPTIGLHNYHILFEVQRWEEYPADPYLLRRIDGMLFVVWAEWELTELERSLLGSIASGT